MSRLVRTANDEMKYVVGMYSVVQKYEHKADIFCLRERLHVAIEQALGAELDWERIDQQKELSCQAH